MRFAQLVSVAVTERVELYRALASARSELRIVRSERDEIIQTVLVLKCERDAARQLAKDALRQLGLESTYHDILGL
jgi:uncharacterized coiled-coil DUF342 family protein